MMSTNGHLPAHPARYVQHPPGEVGNQVAIYAEGAGLSKREAFALAVDVNAYRPIDTFEIAHGRRPTVEELADYIASVRLIEADALLAALEATP
jgi:hypothetical protein